MTARSLLARDCLLSDIDLAVCAKGFRWGHAGVGCAACDAERQPAAEHSSTPVFDATRLVKPTGLGTGWLIHGGDDPDGSKGWAQPGFDDSQWVPFDAEKPESLHTLFPEGNPGVVWYRLHLKVTPTDRGLALDENNISDAFIVYSDGVDLIHEGTVRPLVPYSTYNHVIASIPESQVTSGNIVLALRVALMEAGSDNLQFGLYPGNLVLGQKDQLREHLFYTHYSKRAERYIDSAISLALGIVSLLLYGSQRQRREYLWLFFYGLSAFCRSSFLIALFNSYPLYWNYLLSLPAGAESFFMARAYLAFVQQKVSSFSTILVLLVSVSVTLRADLELAGIAHAQLLEIFEFSLFVFVLPTILLKHWRCGNREAGILLIPLVLSSLSSLVYFAQDVIPVALVHQTAARIIENLFSTRIGPFQVSFLGVTDIASWFALTLIILLRTNRLSREGAFFQSELAAAREIQQVLVPETMEATPGFLVESVYLPAQQVGGDFFQIMPTANGGLLLVIGDVAGKGLPAAMLVSVMVGAIRTAAAYGHAPQEMLAQLNARLLGRARGGFSTALAAFFNATGLVTIVNAGHLSPYLDGAEVELPGALPLGITSEAEYESTHFHMGPASRLTFYSDGVVEAQNNEGQLFGFERGRIVSTEPAATIAEKAKSFGQSDDITVIAVTRV